MSMRRAGVSREPRERRSFHGQSVGGAEGGAGVVSAAAGSAGSGSWDPYEVWLTRVKQPREEIERARSRSSRPVSSRPVKDDGSEGLSPALFR